MFETTGPVYQGSWGFKELTIGLIAILSRLFQRSNKNIKRSREQEPQQYIFVRIQATIAPYTPCPFVICRIDSVYLYTFNDLAYIYWSWGHPRVLPTFSTLAEGRIFPCTNERNDGRPIKLLHQWDLVEWNAWFNGNLRGPPSPNVNPKT